MVPVMSTAIGIYVCCPPDGATQELHIDPPADCTTPEGVASFLRFGAHMGGSVLENFTWEGQTYDSMGRPWSAPA